MSYEDNGVNILTQLGLTIRQAEVYLAIVELEQPTARTIAQTLRIARSEAYRAATELQKLGLIKKIITAPTAFKAIPLSEGLTILLERKTEEDQAIRNEAKKFLRNFDHVEKPSQEDSKYYLTVGFKTVERDYLRDLSEAQKSKDCVLDWRGILNLVNRHFEYVKEALERGVEIRYVTHIPEGTKMPQIIQTLTETGLFEVKSVSTIPKANIDIFDKKTVHLMMLPNDNLKQIEVLRSQNPKLAELAQDYFELKWQTATTPNWHKNQQMKAQIRNSPESEN